MLEIVRRLGWQENRIRRKIRQTVWKQNEAKTKNRKEGLEDLGSQIRRCWQRWTGIMTGRHMKRTEQLGGKKRCMQQQQNKPTRAAEMSMARQEKSRSRLVAGPAQDWHRPRSQFSGAELRTVQPVSQLSVCFPLALCLARLSIKAEDASDVCTKVTDPSHQKARGIPVAWEDHQPSLLSHKFLSIETSCFYEL